MDVKGHFRELIFLHPCPNSKHETLCDVCNQVWLCGGSVEVMPCSRIAHIERAHKPYTEDLATHVRRNALRVAEVWMDEFKSHVYMAWNVPQQVLKSLMFNKATFI